MLKDIILPAISENVESGEVIGILVSVGQVVEKDQPVVELETEKAAFEVPSPERGTITEIDVKEGQTVKVGEVLARLETDAQAAVAQPPRKAREEQPTAPSRPAEQAGRVGRVPNRDESRLGSPLAPSLSSAEKQQPVSPPVEQPQPALPVVAGPSVRQFARELGVNIAEVTGTGPGGQISRDDVKRYARQSFGVPRSRGPNPPEGGTPNEAPETARSLPDFAQWGDIERQPMSRTRRTIADAMSYAWTHIPQVTHYDRADITELEAFRKAHAAQMEKGGAALSLTGIAVRIAASALKGFPQFNASVDSERNEVVYKKYCHIGVAVDTDHGLLVPVIRDVDKKSIREVCAELAELARKARDKQITPEDMVGGCFTVSNLGGIGGTGFSPIVYWPQVAILGISRAAREAVPQEGAIRERLILPLSLSFDHRVIDGADGARFLHWIAQALEQPLRMML